MAVVLQSNLYIEDGPFDAGLKVVSTKEELKTISDPYDGMIAVVTEEGHEGLYVLYHAANLSSWVKIMWDGDQPGDQYSSSIVITSLPTAVEFWKSLVTLQLDPTNKLTISPLNSADTLSVFINDVEQESVSGQPGVFSDLEQYQLHTIKIISAANNSLGALTANIYIGDTTIWWPTDSETGTYIVGELDNELNDKNFGEGIEYSLTSLEQSVNIPSDTKCYYTYGTNRASALAVIDKSQSADGNLNILLGSTGQYVIVWLESQSGEDAWKREKFIEAPSSSIQLVDNTYADQALQQQGLKLRIQEHALEAYCSTTNEIRVTLNGNTTTLASDTWTRIPNTEWNKKLSVQIIDVNNSSVGSAKYEVVIGKDDISYPGKAILVNAEGQWDDINVSKVELESGSGNEYTITAPTILSVKVSSKTNSNYNFNLTEGVLKTIETAPSDSQDYYIDFLWEDATITITEENSSIPSDLTVTITY